MADNSADYEALSADLKMLVDRDGFGDVLGSLAEISEEKASEYKEGHRLRDAYLYLRDAIDEAHRRSRNLKI